jgi:hypothetical protein
MIKRNKPPRHLRPKTLQKIAPKLHLHGNTRRGLHTWPCRVPLTTFQLVRGPLDGKPRPQKFSDSHDPGSSRLTPSLIHLLTEKAFNATTSTNVVTAPSAWFQRSRLITLFTAHPGMGSEKVPLFMPHQALFSHRRPLDSQNDNCRARVS